MRARELRAGDRVVFNWGSHFPIDEGVVEGVEATWGIYSVVVRLDEGPVHYLGLGDLSIDDPDQKSASPVGWKLLEKARA